MVRAELKLAQFCQMQNYDIHELHNLKGGVGGGREGRNKEEEEPTLARGRQGGMAGGATKC